MRRVPDGDPSANGNVSIQRPDGSMEHLADFALEPSEPGIVPARVVDELRRCYREARDYTQALGDAIKNQAEKYAIDAGALRKYVAALEGDKVEDTRKEIEDLQRLIEAGV